MSAPARKSMSGLVSTVKDAPSRVVRTLWFKRRLKRILAEEVDRTVRRKSLLTTRDAPSIATSTARLRRLRALDASIPPNVSLWRVLVIALGILVTLGVLWLNDREAHSANARIDAHTQGVEIYPQEGAASHIELRMGVECVSLNIDGVAQYRYGDRPTRDAADPYLTDLLRERADVETPVVAISSVVAPPGWQIGVDYRQSTLRITLTPRRRAEKESPPRGGVPVVTLGLGEGLELVEHDGIRPVQAGDRLSIIGDDKRPLIIVAELSPEASRLRQSFDMEGVQTSDLTFNERDLAIGNRRIMEVRSRLLRGVVRFPNIQTPDKEIMYREFLSAESFKGHIVALVLEPDMPFDDLAPSDVSSHVRVIWEGKVAALKAGFQSSSRPVMPTSLRAFFGTSERMYISAILIYVGIFLLAILRGRPLGAADHLYPDDLM